MRTTSVMAKLVLLLAVSPCAAQTLEFDWVRQFSGTDTISTGSPAVDNDGNLYICGSFYGTVDLDPGPGVFNLTNEGGTDVFIAKLDAAGLFVWAKQITATSSAYPSGIVADGAGNVYTIGSFYGTVDLDPGPATHLLTAVGFGDIFITKLDANGDFLWAGRTGGSSSDFPADIVMDGAGDLYVTGNFRGRADLDPRFGHEAWRQSDGDTDVFITKIDADGNFDWAMTFGGTDLDWLAEIAFDGAGDLHATGSFYGTSDFDPTVEDYELTSVGENDVFISKLDSWVLVWAIHIGGAGTDEASDIHVDSAGNVYIAGFFEGTADFDPGPDVHELTSAGDRDVFISKLDAAGDLVWAHRIGGLSTDRGGGIAFDNAGDLYLTGTFGGQVDFDPGPGTHYLTATETTGLFILKLDADGNHVWAKKLGGPGLVSGGSLIVDDFGNAYIGGRFRWTIDFDPGPDTHELSSTADSHDGYLCRFSGECEHFVDRSAYGTLLFPPLCTRDASELPGERGDDYTYSSTLLGINRRVNDALYLSSSGTSMEPLVVDEAVRCNGSSSGLGPYADRDGVPPYTLDAPIDYNLVSLPAHDITTLVPPGASEVLFELVDTQREIYGNTAVYLVRDCGIYPEPGGTSTFQWLSHDVEIGGLESNLEVVSGTLSELRNDHGYASACHVGSFVSTTQFTDSRPGPASGDGYYYLVSGTCAVAIGYGDSTLVPDPRDGLPPGSTCP
jgi:hypothetical protein